MGIYGAVSASFTILFLQALPAIIALALTALFVFGARWHRLPWIALCLALLGLLLANVNSADISDIRIDFSEELEAAAQLFTLRAVIREATDIVETGASDRSAALKKLGRLQEEALEVKGPNAEAPGQAAGIISIFEQEVRGIAGRHRRAYFSSEEDGGAFLETSMISSAMACKTRACSLSICCRKRSLRRYFDGFRLETPR